MEKVRCSSAGETLVGDLYLPATSKRVPAAAIIDPMAHTTRAALTGLQKKSHMIEPDKRGETPSKLRRPRVVRAITSGN